MGAFNHANGAPASAASAPPPSPPPDLATAQRFLHALGPGERFFFQTFWDDEEGKKRLRDLKKVEKAGGVLNDHEREERDRLAKLDRSLTRQAFGTLGEYDAMLASLNEAGAGVFVTVNVTDGQGRKEENITGLRALFIDGDGIPMPTAWPIEPNILVRRDDLHWHAYWFLLPGEPLEAFKNAQHHLARYYGSDPAICDPPRVMRLPGFAHRKGAPVPVMLAHCVPEPRRTIAEILAAHPVTPEPSSETKAKPKKKAGNATATSEDPTAPRFEVNWLEEGPPPLEKLELARQKDLKIAELLDGRADWLRDKSGSGRDMALAARLARHSWTPNEICRVLRWWPHGSKSEAVKNGERYYARTLEHAVASSRYVTVEDLTDLLVLGEDAKGNVVLFNRGTRTLREFRVAQLRYEDLLQLGGEQAARLVSAPSRKRAKVPVGEVTLRQIAFDRLREEIAVLAGKTKLGHLEEVGNGIWPLDDGLLLVGDDVVVLRPDGGVEQVTTPVYRGRYIRRDPCRAMLPVSELLRRMQVMDAARTRGTVKMFAQMLGQWALKHPTDKWLMAGMALGSVMQTVWAWRPQVWVTGPTGAAKSLMFSFLARVLGPTTDLIQGKTSEAGLRQDAAVHSAPHLIDEFDEMAGHKRQALLDLARSAGPGGWVVKGTPGHAPMRFRVCYILWFASIEVSLDRAADANRFIVVEMGVLKPHIDAPTAVGVEDLGLDLLSALLRFAPRARALESRLSAVAVAGMQGRLVRNMAVPAAVVGALLGLSDLGAERLMRHWLRVHARDEVVPQVPDEERLLQAILASHVEDRMGHRTTVGAMLERGSIDALGTYGIREMPDHCGLFVDPDAVRRHLLRGTRWGELNIRTILARLPGASSDRQRVNGSRVSGISIPWEALGLQPKAPRDAGLFGRSGSATTGKAAAAGGGQQNPAPTPRVDA